MIEPFSPKHNVVGKTNNETQQAPPIMALDAYRSRTQRIGEKQLLLGYAHTAFCSVRVSTRHRLSVSDSLCLVRCIQHHVARGATVAASRNHFPDTPRTVIVL